MPISEQERLTSRETNGRDAAQTHLTGRVPTSDGDIAFITAGDEFAIVATDFRLATRTFQVMMPPLPAPANTILLADEILLGDAGGNVIPVALDQVTILILQVDEPGTLALLGLGMAALAWQRRRALLLPRRT